MSNGFFKTPVAVNEPVKSYAKGTIERKELLDMYDKMYKEKIDIPLYIGSEEVLSGDTVTIHPPHEHKHILGTYHRANSKHIELAIEKALESRQAWADTPWEQRAAVFLKAAELLAGPYRAKMNASTMLAQSKNVYQAEIDSACEMIDFFRFNSEFMAEIYDNQPESSTGVWNRMEYRPLEGFIYAVSPFNFTSIAANLFAAPAIMGNVVIWKPSDYQVYSAKIIVELFKSAGLPDGVVNVVYGDPAMITDTLMSHKMFSGIHFTGSTSIFKQIWKKVGDNIETYKTYPRIVGETGGKDFIWVHKSANPIEVAVNIIRGAFEYQGQKCSAASRAYIPKSIWNEIHSILETEIATIKVGSPSDPKNFVNAVIHEDSFDKITYYIEKAKNSKDAKVIIGGGYDKSKGYFIEPTVILTTNPSYQTMELELFGPVITIYLYEDNKWEESLSLVDNTSKYALTGAIFAKDRFVITKACKALENSAGNFYINDKPTGAVVGQQPFGGARGSGTNDKAGSIWNLLRWVSNRTIKENLLTDSNYRYPFLQ